MRNFLKTHKTNLLLLGGAIILYAIFFAFNALAEEYPSQPEAEIIIENMPETAHVLNDVHNFSIAPSNIAAPPEWIARIAIHEMRINQILRRDVIIRRLLEMDELQIFLPLYEEMLEFLELALTQRHLIAEADITNLIDSTISMQEFLMLETFRNNIQGETTAEGVEIIISNLMWLVGLSAVSIGISVMAMFAVLWGRAT
jgi:hypothetical protein